MRGTYVLSGIKSSRLVYQSPSRAHHQLHRIPPTNSAHTTQPQEQITARLCRLYPEYRAPLLAEVHEAIRLGCSISPETSARPWPSRADDVTPPEQGVQLTGGEGTEAGTNEQQLRSTINAVHLEITRTIDLVLRKHNARDSLIYLKQLITLTRTAIAFPVPISVYQEVQLKCKEAQTTELTDDLTRFPYW